MELWVCGFSGHGQLSLAQQRSELRNGQVMSSSKDLFNFEKVASGKNIRVLYACFSQTALVIDNKLHLLGYTAAFPDYRQVDPEHEPAASSVASFTENTLADLRTIHSPFGTDNGLLGSICASNGALQNLSVNASGRAQFVSVEYPNQSDNPPPLSALACTSSGATTAIFFASPAANTMHLACFPTLELFQKWHAYPSNPTLTTHLKHHMLPGKFCQLIAGATSFTLLTREGIVFTWGDARYAHILGRKVQGGWEKPGVLEVLGGLQLTKICAGGFMSGAVTDADDAYLWGGWGPEVPLQSKQHEVRQGVQRLGDGDELDDGVVRIRLPVSFSNDNDKKGNLGTPHADYEEDDNNPGITDLAIGRSHVLALSSTGHIWSAGVGDNGQLGIGISIEREKGIVASVDKSIFSPDWNLVRGASREPSSSWEAYLRQRGLRVLNIACGDLSSFAVVGSDSSL